jgi:CRP-like cAMP-binding protein
MVLAHLIREAVQASALRELAPPTRTALMAAAIPSQLPARTIYLEEGSRIHPALLLDGLMRASITAPTGRQVTVSYMRAADLVDFVRLFGAPTPATMETVTECRLLGFASDLVMRVAEGDLVTMRTFARVATRRLAAMVEELTIHVFGTVRERVSHHLLDLAMDAGPGRPLVADVTQQQLALATGASRESVGRVLSLLMKSGVIRRTANGLILERPLQLHPSHAYWRRHRMPVV